MIIKNLQQCNKTEQLIALITQQQETE